LGGAGRPLRGGSVDGVIGVGGEDARRGGKARRLRARQHAGSRRSLQHIARRAIGDALGEIARIGFKNQRNEVSFVSSGIDPTKSLSVVAIASRSANSRELDQASTPRCLLCRAPATHAGSPY